MKKGVILLLTVLLCGLCVAAFAGESAHEMAFSDLFFRPEIRLNSDVQSAGFFISPDLSGKPAGRITADDEVTLAGAGKKYWIVRYGEQTGYVSRSRMSVTGAADGHAPVSSIVLSSTIEIPAAMVRPRDEEYIAPEGTMELSGTVDYLAFFLWDEWQRKLERTWVFFPDEPVSTLNAADWYRIMPTKDLKAGRKTLCIEGFSGGNGVVLARLPFFVAGKTDDPVNLNGRCTFLPNDDRLLDGRVETYWSPSEKRPEVTITLPEDGSAALVQIEWYEIPDKTEITVADGSGNVILNQSLETGFYVDAVSLPEGARTIAIHPYGKRVRMSSVRIYGEDYPREVVQRWQDMPDKLDILLFSTHQDDEVLFYSGLVPWYSHLGKKIGIVYMANCTRARYREALDGMWISGLRIHPVFLGYRDKDVASIDVATNIWQGSQTAVVRQIRRCRPDIIVVQDQNGEYGHTQHRLTSRQVCEGVKLAADPEFDPESAAEYGVWDTPKLYVHLYEENQVHMNWNIPLEECGGLTPWQIAVEAFEMHHSQYGYFRMERQSVTYDSSLFGLYRSTVGPDTSGNDMFDNLE